MTMTVIFSSNNKVKSNYYCKLNIFMTFMLKISVESLSCEYIRSVFFVQNSVQYFKPTS